MSERLYRSRQDRMLAGVAGGLAELWNADPSLVRIIWALLVIFTGGLALVVYIVMAIVVPEGDPEPWPDTWPSAASSVPDAPTADGAPAAAGAASAPPRSTASTAVRPGRRGSGSGTGGLIAGLVLVGLGVFFLVREWLPEIDFDWLWPVMLIVLGLVLLLAALGRRPSDPGAGS